MDKNNCIDKNNQFSSPEGISLKEYINDKFNNLEKAIDARFDTVTQTTTSALASADKAITKSDIALEKRLDSVNEFRNTLSDQARNFLTKAEFDAKWENVDKNRKDNTSLIISVLGIIIAVISLIVKFI